MAEKKRYPVNLDSFEALVEAAGYHEHSRHEGSLVFVIEGSEVFLQVHVIAGRTPNAEEPWFVRLLSYSINPNPETQVAFEPMKAGVPRERLLEWLNSKNADLLFGRYYHDAKWDTVAFEVAMPCNDGILAEDFDLLLTLATVSVDTVHAELKALVPPPNVAPDQN